MHVFVAKMTQKPRPATQTHTLLAVAGTTTKIVHGKTETKERASPRRSVPLRMGQYNATKGDTRLRSLRGARWAARLRAAWAHESPARCIAHGSATHTLTQSYDRQENAHRAAACPRHAPERPPSRNPHSLRGGRDCNHGPLDTRVYVCVCVHALSESSSTRTRTMSPGRYRSRSTVICITRFHFLLPCHTVPGCGACVVTNIQRWQLHCNTALRAEIRWCDQSNVHAHRGTSLCV